MPRQTAAARALMPATESKHPLPGRGRESGCCDAAQAGCGSALLVEELVDLGFRERAGSAGAGVPLAKGTRAAAGALRAGATADRRHR